jgi:hypothetical protein
MNINDMAAMQGYRGQAYGLGGYEKKDPTVATASDAVTALKKRQGEIQRELDKVDGWKTELATIERMLVASESK